MPPEKKRKVEQEQVKKEEEPKETKADKKEDDIKKEVDGKKEEENGKKDESKKEEEKQNDEDESMDSEDEGSEEKQNDGDRELGKRKRKSSVESAFEPADFTMQGTKQVKIIKGRGKKLKQMSSVVASMERHSLEDVLFAHKFLFGNRGSALKKKELMTNLLEFSGYLKEVPKGYDKDKLEAEDEFEEVRSK